MFKALKQKVELIKWRLVLVCCLVVSTTAHSQTKIYLSAGAMGSNPYGGVYFEDNNYSRRLGFITKFGAPAIDLSFVNRITGSLYSTWGLGSVFLSTEVFDTNENSKTEYKQIYITTPVMLRLNLANRNMVYFDFGVVPTYLLSGNLKEVSTDGLVQDEGNVTQKVPRFDLLFRFSNSFAVNRFSFGYRADIKLTKKYAAQLNELKEAWALGSESFFIRDYDGNAFQFVYGIFIGYRLK